ncbi:MAG TPA: hypothetical protein VMJ93_14965 [Verrucomicrobiae bacterium]|nr:hypothetical protein [Verrucomicrobiae bacterium]
MPPNNSLGAHRRVVRRGTLAVNGRLAKEHSWEIPAAWRAVVKDGLIAEWQVYCDNEPVRKIMAEIASRKPAN